MKKRLSFAGEELFILKMPNTKRVFFRADGTVISSTGATDSGGVNGTPPPPAPIAPPPAIDPNPVPMPPVYYFDFPNWSTLSCGDLKNQISNLQTYMAQISNSEPSLYAYCQEQLAVANKYLAACVSVDGDPVKQPPIVVIQPPVPVPILGDIGGGGGGYGGGSGGGGGGGSEKAAAAAKKSWLWLGLIAAGVFILAKGDKIKV